MEPRPVWDLTPVLLRPWGVTPSTGPTPVTTGTTYYTCTETHSSGPRCHRHSRQWRVSGTVSYSCTVWYHVKQCVGKTCVTVTLNKIQGVGSWSDHLFTTTTVFSQCSTPEPYHHRVVRSGPELGPSVRRTRTSDLPTFRRVREVRHRHSQWPVTPL